MIKSRIKEILGIRYPIIQGGMAWIADASLAAAVSNAGGLGLISSVNAGTDAVRAEIRKCKNLTDKPFGVNIMLQAPNAAEIAQMVIEEGVKILTTGAGSPAPYMEAWKAAGITVIPVVASVALALKVQALGADAVAIATSALIAIGCQQFKMCNTGRCPMGLTSQDKELRKNIDVERAAERLANFLRVSTEEIAQFARITGHRDVHELCIEDLCTVNSEISNYTAIRHV